MNYRNTISNFAVSTSVMSKFWGDLFVEIARLWLSNNEGTDKIFMRVVPHFSGLSFDVLADSSMAAFKFDLQEAKVERVEIILYKDDSMVELESRFFNCETLETDLMSDPEVSISADSVMDLTRKVQRAIAMKRRRKEHISEIEQSLSMLVDAFSGGKVAFDPSVMDWSEKSDEEIEQLKNRGRERDAIARRIAREGRTSATVFSYR